MNPETLKLLVTFMQRVDLKGAEVPAYNQVMGELAKLDAQNRIQAELASRTPQPNGHAAETAS